MEFDSSFREDFPFLSSLFSEKNNSSPTLKHEFGNGFTLCADGISSSSSSSSSSFKGLLPNSFFNPNQNQISVEGSSKNPFPGTCKNSFVPYLAGAGGFSDDLNAYVPVSALPFPAPDQHGGAKNGPCQGSWNFSEGIGSTDYESFPQTEDHSFDHQPPVISAKVADEVSSHVAVGSDDDDEMQNNQTRRVSKDNIIKGQWSPQEDRVLKKLVSMYGTKKWSEIANMLTRRVGKQCRERWQNHLRPDIKKDSWSEEEDMTLIRAHMKIGNKWAEIAKKLPGRTENTIKNHWNATKRKQTNSRLKGKGHNSNGNLLQKYIKSLENNNYQFPGLNYNNVAGDHENENALNYPAFNANVFPDEQESYSPSFEPMLPSYGSDAAAMRLQISHLEMDSEKRELDLLEMISQGNR